MKTNIIFLLALLWSSMLFGQWEITGNNGINVTNNFLGTLDDADLRFRTDNLFRMHLDGTTGFLGLNTTSPQMRFHVEEGGILSTGTTGTNTITGAGTRLMWIPDRAAFREQPYTISSDSKHQELQSFTRKYVECTFNHYFHLPDYRIGHPPQTERSTWNIKMPKPCS